MKKPRQYYQIQLYTGNDCWEQFHQAYEHEIGELDNAIEECKDHRDYYGSKFRVVRITEDVVHEEH